jgi:hypothetical protein
MSRITKPRLDGNNGQSNGSGKLAKAKVPQELSTRVPAGRKGHRPPRQRTYDPRIHDPGPDRPPDQEEPARKSLLETARESRKLKAKARAKSKSVKPARANAGDGLIASKAELKAKPKSNSPRETPGPLCEPSDDIAISLRTPSYSLDRALALIETGQEPVLTTDDYETGRIYEYLVRSKRCTTYRQQKMLDVRMHTVATGYKVHKENGPLRWVLEAYLLTDLDFNEIGTRVGLVEDIVYWYERIFFRVRDRMAARDWIALKAIGKTVPPGATDHDLDIILKWLVFLGGRAVLELCLPDLLPDEDGDPTSPAEAAREEQVRCLAEALCISSEEAFLHQARLAERTAEQETVALTVK